MHDPRAEDSYSDDDAADLDKLTQEFGELARVLQQQPSPQKTLDAICRLAAEVIGAADHASISVRTGERIETVAATDPVPEMIDQLQYRTGEGPCLDAMDRHEVFRTGDLSREERWPTFGPLAASEADIHSMLCFRLFIQGETLGALNLFATGVDAFSDHNSRIGTAFAAHAAVAMQAARSQGGSAVLALDVARLETVVSQLTHALEYRIIIERAIGYLMASEGLTVEDAFDQLRNHARDRRIRVISVAQQVLSTGAVPPAGS